MIDRGPPGQGRQSVSKQTAGGKSLVEHRADATVEIGDVCRIDSVQVRHFNSSSRLQASYREVIQAAHYLAEATRDL